ncbi:MAG: glycosyltransferase [Sulfurimonas sp.]|jgi:glycosyltransferase involved in cell wall biosynthesis
MNTIKKIAIVNVLFPPKALGGATRIAVDEALTISKQYSSDFEVVVFTADVQRRPVDILNVYPLSGIRVYEISKHINNWIEKDEKSFEIFEKFIDFEKPDLIHFHCIQVLTASMVEATQKRNIPHLITVHDAWWISDYQFLIDEKGNVYPEGHPDPFKPFTLPDGITLEQSIKRRNYLKELLNNSNGVLAVSDTFRQIYEKNGVSNVITNKNGISDDVEWRDKNTSHTDKVICAHIGGMSPHKGFDVFKQAILSLHTSHIEILIIDHTKNENHCTKTRWGNMDVTILGHVNQNKIADIYQQIDVLFAPSTCPESFGLVTREATACGCWVVASDLGGIGEDVTPENGFRITPTKENISKVFHEIDKNPKKYKELSKSVHIRRSSEQVEEIVGIFKTILKESEKRKNRISQ